jgi:hypothetical protein
LSAPPLVRIASDWDCSAVLRQTPRAAGLWDGIQFTTEAVPECDFLVMCNNRKLDAVAARCAPDHVWAIMQEPYIPGLHDWLLEGHECYARVFTHLVPDSHARYVPSAPLTPWGIGLSYDELVSAAIPAKPLGVSWIASNLSWLPGHRLRNALRRRLMRESPRIVDLFGRGIRWIPRKWEALAPYRFSIAIENSSGPHLWTEKIADCFLSWTVPLYYGCTNLEDYFPEDSFVRIDPGDPESVVARIQELLSGDEWQRRLPALEIARRLVLEEHQLFPFLAHAVRSCSLEARLKADIVVPGYREVRRKHQLRYLRRLARQGDVRQLAEAVANKLKYLWWSASAPSRESGP